MKPDISVIVIMLGGADHLARWLEAIQAQEDAPDMEILIPHDRRFGDPPVALNDGRARYLTSEGPATYAELRSLGLREAKAPIVMITEDHCLPRPEWARSILRLHQTTPYAAIGGPLDKTGRDTVLNWGIYLQDFSRYMMPVPAGPAGYLTDCNVSYKRDKLNTIHALWADEFHETPVNWTLLENGETLWLDPALAVGQRRDVMWGRTISERYRFGRLFASTRVGKVGRVKGLVYAALVWILPLLIVFRVGRDVFKKQRAIGHYLVALPTIAFMSSVWALGEFVGYLTGRAGESLQPAD